LDFKKFAHSNRRGKLLDATFGLGGYELLMSDFNLDILGIEIDGQSLHLAEKIFPGLPKKSFQLRLVKGNFRNIDYLAGNLVLPKLTLLFLIWEFPVFNLNGRNLVSLSGILRVL